MEDDALVGPQEGEEGGQRWEEGVGREVDGPADEGPLWKEGAKEREAGWKRESGGHDSGRLALVVL